MPRRPLVVAFDIIQTVLSIEPLREEFTRSGLPGEALEIWFGRTLRDGFALAASGTFQPFARVAKGTLQGVGVGLAKEDLEELERRLFQKFTELPLQPGARAATALLRDAGLRVLALSNGSEANTHAALKKAGLLDQFERVVSIDEVGHWKPRPEVYEYCARVAGVSPGSLALVAAHGWDCHGAGRAGLITAWVSHVEKVHSPAFSRPDVTAESLLDSCRSLTESAL
jgi:2-haloacid dehalogenase